MKNITLKCTLLVSLFAMMLTVMSVVNAGEMDKKKIDKQESSYAPAGHAGCPTAV